MTPSRKFIELIQALASAFRQEIDEPMLLAYWIALDDVPTSDIERAVRVAIRESKFMPPAAELRQAATGAIPSDHLARLAWEDVRRAMMVAGYYRSVDFEDKTINATIRNMGGWVRLCEIEDDRAMAFERQRFEKTYVAFLRSGAASSNSTRGLGGMYEQANGDREPPLIIECSNREIPAIESRGKRQGALTSCAALGNGGERVADE